MKIKKKYQQVVSDFIANVEENRKVTAGAISILNHIKQAIESYIDDPEKMKTLKNALKHNTSKIKKNFPKKH